MSPIRIDTYTFDAASAVYGGDIAPMLSTAGSDLSNALVGTGAMAGTDEAGTKWASSYDSAAAQLMPAISDAITASYKMAILLERTGFNHGQAESMSTPGATRVTTDHTHYTGTAPVMVAPDSASGGSGSAPTGWGLVEHAVGYAWPNGHQDTLRAAGAAWSNMAMPLRLASYRTSDADAAISGQKSPEIADALRVSAAMRNHYANLASSCDNMAEACTALASHIDQAHSDVEHQLAWLVGTSAGIEIVGAVASFFSFGAAEAPTQAIEGWRIADAANAIRSILSGLSLAIDAMVARVALVLDRLGAMVPGLRAIAGADAIEAGASAATTVPESAAIAAEQTSVTSLQQAAANTVGNPAIEPGASPWALGWSQRGYTIEDELGGWGDNFPTIDKFPNGVATSIKSIDLEATSYQNTSRLASRVRGYIDKVAKFNGADANGREILARDIEGRALELAVQPGVTTTAQRAILDQMASYAKSQGVDLKIVEVP